MRPAELRIHIRQLCCLGVTGEQLMPALLRAVRQLVGAESAAFFWVDSRGDMTALYAERMLPPPVMRLYFERYYEAGESSFRRAFSERAREAEPVIAVPSAATLQSAYYNEVMRHLDAYHVLYGIVREQGQALGQLSLYRAKSASAFTNAQRSELAAIMRYVAHGVSQRGPCVADASEMLESAEDAVFLVDGNGGLRQLSSAAQRLLALATQGRIGPEQMRMGVDDGARPVLRRLADQLRVAFSAADAGPPRVVIDNAWGPLRAPRLCGIR